MAWDNAAYCRAMEPHERAAGHFESADQLRQIADAHELHGRTFPFCAIPRYPICGNCGVTTGEYGYGDCAECEARSLEGDRDD